MHLPSTFNRPTEEELNAMRMAAKEAVHRHKSGTQPSASAGFVPRLSGTTWRQVLGVPLNEHRRAVAHRAYRTLARAHHPDIRGSNEAMQIVNDAWLKAKRELVLK